MEASLFVINPAVVDGRFALCQQTSECFADGIPVKRNFAKWFLLAGSVLGSSAHLQSFARAGQEPSGESSARGMSMFRKSCSVCHSVRSGEIKVGPSLYGVLRESSGRSEHKVRETILEGKGNMPAFKEKLDLDQVEDLLAYLKTL
jgi:mono/diheme cytochrome c family protein